MLLSLWCRPAAVAPVELLAWDPPYAAGVALKSKKKRKKNPIKYTRVYVCMYEYVIFKKRGWSSKNVIYPPTPPT